ncbi:MAG: hypothetical protein NTW86_01190 [Candidatus Sumerlaeota bacterium]|nr:hypothetical protein [Candidatus Sumerlaeota bacterium]
MWLGAIALAAAWSVVGCGQVHPPRYDYNAEGARVLVKRVPENLAVDTITRIDRVAYEEGSTFTADQLSPEQADVYQTYDPPEYVRKPFKSTRGDIVHEWLYLRHNKLFQWIDGRKVYEGEVTDEERVLLKRGYPMYAWVELDEKGVERQTWIYRGNLDVQADVYSFSGGKMVLKEATE